jgi:hypothetical protein
MVKVNHNIYHAAPAADNPMANAEPIAANAKGEICPIITSPDIIANLYSKVDR